MTFIPPEVKWGVLSGIYLLKERQFTGWEACLPFEVHYIMQRKEVFLYVNCMQIKKPVSYLIC